MVEHSRVYEEASSVFPGFKYASSELVIMVARVWLSVVCANPHFLLLNLSQKRWKFGMQFDTSSVEGKWLRLSAIGLVPHVHRPQSLLQRVLDQLWHVWRHPTQISASSSVKLPHEEVRVICWRAQQDLCENPAQVARLMTVISWNWPKPWRVTCNRKVKLTQGWRIRVIFKLRTLRLSACSSPFMSH